MARKNQSKFLFRWKQLAKVRVFFLKDFIEFKEVFLINIIYNFCRKSFSMVTSVQMFSIFPPKNLEKIRALKIRMRRFFKIFFAIVTVSKFCLIRFHFPAKRLRKIRRPKYACANFFKKKIEFQNSSLVYFVVSYIL